MKEFADDNFRFDENGRKFSKRVENTVGKGEIARYEQFLLFPQCFQKACFPGVSKGVIVWEWVKCFLGLKHLAVLDSQNNLFQSCVTYYYQTGVDKGWFVQIPGLADFFLGIDDCTGMHSSLTANNYFDNGWVEKQPVA